MSVFPLTALVTAAALLLSLPRGPWRHEQLSAFAFASSFSRATCGADAAACALPGFWTLRRDFHTVVSRMPQVPAAPLVPPGGDEDLVMRLLAGDEASFENLVAAHHGAMLRFARIFIAKADVAEEVVQEAWLAVLRSLPTFEGRSSLKTWIFRILANRARTRAAREARVVPFAELASAEDDGGAEAALEQRFTADGHWRSPPADWRVHSPEALVLRQEAMRHLDEALERLPTAQRTVVTLRDVDGWSAGEVCDALQVSEANQRVLLHRARARLRRALDDVLGPR